jgi:hypothetical protein
MPSCPDCEVEMDEVDHKSTYDGESLRIDTAGGILGAINLRTDYLQCYVCPECGLARFYAE